MPTLHPQITAIPHQSCPELDISCLTLKNTSGAQEVGFETQKSECRGPHVSYRARSLRSDKSEPWSGHLVTQLWAPEKYWTNCSPSTYNPTGRHLILMTEHAVNSHPTTAVTQHWFLSIFKWKSKHASPQLLFPGPQNVLPKIHQPTDTARKPH